MNLMGPFGGNEKAEGPLADCQFIPPKTSLKRPCLLILYRRFESRTDIFIGEQCIFAGCQVIVFESSCGGHM